MRIRLAIASDLLEIAACEDLAFNMIPHGSNGSNLSPEGDLEQQIREEKIYVLTDEARLLGYISIAVQVEHLFINSIAVLPEHHRNGLGSRMLEHAEAVGGHKGLKVVMLYTDGSNAGNMKFYQSRGFQESSRCNGVDVFWVCFCKNIWVAPDASAQRRTRILDRSTATAT